MKRSTYILLLLSLLFVKCNINPNNTALLGTWYAHSTSTDLYEDEETEECLSLFSDNTFTLIKGYDNYIYGQWKLNNNGDKVIFKNLYGRNVEPMLIKMINNGKKTLIASQASGKYKFEKVSVPLKKLQDEPYYASNLQWKVRSGQVEPSDSIKLKLINYIDHTSKVLNATLERKEDIINLTFSKGPLKMYQSAIGLIPYEKVNKQWIGTFHNDSTAKIAYSYLEKSILYGNYKKYSSNQWIKDNYKILQDIRTDIENIK